MPVLIFPLRKSAAQVFLWHEIMQHYNACLSDSELRETQTANYFSNFYPIDCAVLSVNA